MSSRSVFSHFAHSVAHLAGRPATFATAVILIVVWAVSGPLFGFSETWQLVINTATTIITFLMVFVLQNSQNRDGEAVQAKLDELIYALRGADNHFVAAERLEDAELKNLRDLLVDRARKTTEVLEKRGIVAAHPGKNSDKSA
ncbi:MAG: low affinity iron permease family protein [Devosia sp.]